MPVDNGTGTTITFGTSGFTANVSDVGWGGLSRESIETTHLGTATARTFLAGDLYDAGEVTLSIQFDPDDTPPVMTAAETITITYPLSSGGTTPASWAATGFATDFGNEAALETLMTGDITIKLSGAITITPEA